MSDDQQERLAEYLTAATDLAQQADAMVAIRDGGAIREIGHTSSYNAAIAHPQSRMSIGDFISALRAAADRIERQTQQ